MTHSTENNQVAVALDLQDGAKRIAIQHAKLRERETPFDRDELGFSETKTIVDLLEKINSYFSKQLDPNSLVLLSLQVLVEKMKEVGVPIDSTSPDLSSFTPLAASNPGFQELAEMTIRVFPDLSIPEFVLRCTGKDSIDVNPVDFAILSAVYKKAQAQTQATL